MQPLDPWIIEEILKREKEKRRRDKEEQPQLPVPEQYPEEPSERPTKEPDEGDRGVVYIEPGEESDILLQF